MSRDIVKIVDDEISRVHQKLTEVKELFDGKSVNELLNSLRAKKILYYRHELKALERVKERLIA